MSLAYQTALTNGISGAMQTSNALTDQAAAMKTHAKEDGFTTAGAWYMTMAQVSYAINSLSQNISPSIQKTATEAQYGDGNTIWFKAGSMIDTAINSSGLATQPSGGAVGDQSAAWTLIMKEMGTTPWAGTPGQSVVNWIITDNSGEPVIIRVKNMADRMVTLGMMVIAAVGAALGVYNDPVSNGIADVAVAVVTGGTGIVAKAALLGAIKPFLDMAEFVAQISMGFFLMCSIYLPMVPFIIFMGQVLNWMINVVEGVAAAPFLGFAHFDTDGEGLGSKTEYGYIFMLQSFMRPTMLVLGFMFACLLLEVIGGYLMQIYPTVIANVQMDSMTGFFSILGFIAIFMVLMVGLINTSMTVTYLLPDAIFAFIGAHNSATADVGRNEASKMEQAGLGGAAISRQGNPMALDKQGASSRRKPEPEPGPKPDSVGPAGSGRGE